MLTRRALTSLPPGNPDHTPHVLTTPIDHAPLRYEVAQLLQRLWARDDARASIITQCSSKKFTVL